MISAQVQISLLITLLAGLSTCIGSVAVIIKRNIGDIYLSISLAFSAGVMVFVSFNEILPEGKRIMASGYGANQGPLFAYGLFFLGIILTAFIDKLVPVPQNPHELSITRQQRTLHMDMIRRNKLKRMGLFTAVVIMLHNFPEGIATFMTSMNDIKLGFPIAIAVALHNIPEGIVVSVPIFYATGSKWRAFKLAAISGLAEPLGALLTYLILMPYFSEIMYGAVMSVVAGIMVYISFDELLPSAQEYGEHHIAIWSLIAGMLAMAISLVII
ncbi:MAG: zinc transporter ZupT [Clostridiaceae bacterium]